MKPFVGTMMAVLGFVTVVAAQPQVACSVPTVTNAVPSYRMRVTVPGENRRFVRVEIRSDRDVRTTPSQPLL